MDTTTSFHVWQEQKRYDHRGNMKGKVTTKNGISTIECATCSKTESITSSLNLSFKKFGKLGWSLRRKQWTCRNCAPNNYRHEMIVVDGKTERK